MPEWKKTPTDRWPDAETEVNKGACPQHPDVFQSPTMDGYGGHSHRIWVCRECGHITHDPDCAKCAKQSAVEHGHSDSGDRNQDSDALDRPPPAL